MNSSANIPSGRLRGSAFVTVIIFTFVMAMLAASILSWSITERRINMQMVYWVEARNAAEALCEYGASQVVNLYNNYASPPAFDPYGGTSSTNFPLQPPPSTFFSGSHVNSTALSGSNKNGYELIGGKAVAVPSGGNMFYVDPNDPTNINDPLSKQMVARNDIVVMAKATSVPPNGDPPITAYVTETVSVRGEPLFANALFYANNDLELTNVGPNMDIYGPVHVNGNLFVSCDNNLNFHYPVSVTGNLYYSSEGTAGNNGAPSGGTVSFATDSAGDTYPLKATSTTPGGATNVYSGTWCDSTMGLDSASGTVTGLASLTPLLTTSANFHGTTETATAAFTNYVGSIWNTNKQENVQTGILGANPYNPAGFTLPLDSAGDLPDALPAESGATGNTDTHLGYDGTPQHGNVSYINDPPDQSLSSSDTYYAGKQALEQAKFSNQSGLYVLVQVNPGTNGNPDTATITYYGPGDLTRINASGRGPNGGVQLGQITVTAAAATGNEPTGLVSFVPYQAAVNGTTLTNGTNVAYTTGAKIGSGTHKNQYPVYAQSTPYTTNQAVTATINGAGVNSTPVNNGSPSTTNGSSTTDTSTILGYTTSTSSITANAVGTISSLPTPPAPTSSTTFASTGATVNQGMYDQRQKTGIDLVQIDMKALNTALTNVNKAIPTGAILNNSNGGNIWGAGSGGSGATADNTSGWNGGIYVDVEAPSSNQVSVGLANGTVASGSSLIPNDAVGGTNPIVGPNRGLTIATNAPMYVEGHFNADGSTASGDAQNPDDGNTTGATSHEVPVALVSDAITILSPGYFGTTGSNNPYFPSGATPGTTTLNITSSSNAYNSLSSMNPNPLNLGSSGPEVAAAFISGIDASTGGNFSGGAHNFPRFLEKWGGTVTIRGSIVNLYDSKVATAPWDGSSYYSAPTRHWGFDKLFQNGTYPPLTPHVISFRRIYFNDLSAAAYTSLRVDTTKGWPSDSASFTPVH